MMRRLWIVSVLMFGIGIGCVAATVAQSFVVPPARAGTNPTRWEVLCVDEDSADVGDIEVEDFAASDGWGPVLKKYGELGWEPFATAFRPVRNRDLVGVCFKRPLP